MMNYLSILLSPFSLMFLIIILGSFIGKIRIKKISIGIAGILFVAIFSGYLINRFIPIACADSISELRDTMKTFSTLGTSLFVSVIGLHTGLSINGKSASSFIALSIGSVMSIAGVMTMLLISIFDKSIKISSLLGVLCGALTSTPGLSSVCELMESDSGEAVWGYGCAYLFGVILAVFFVQLSSLNTKRKQIDESNDSCVNIKIYPEFILICVSALLGTLLGGIQIPFINISLGNTTGILFASLCIGAFAKKIKIEVSEQVLQLFKHLGLALFFSGMGFNTGTQIIRFDIKMLIYGIIISLTAIICGMFLCKMISRQYCIDSRFIIAGGMTSSPAYGAISTKADVSSSNLFSFAYFGALISLVTAIRIILY